MRSDPWVSHQLDHFETWTAFLLPMPSAFTVSWQLLRQACGQVTRQRHLSHLQAEDSPMNNSERKNHLRGPFFQPRALSLTITG